MTLPPLSPSRPGQHSLAQSVEMRMILVAGGDLELMRDASMHLFSAGHLPVMVEWFTELHDLPHPLSERLLGLDEIKVALVQTGLVAVCRLL